MLNRFSSLVQNVIPYLLFFQSPLLPKFQLLFGIHPVTSIAVRLIFRFTTSTESYSVSNLVNIPFGRLYGNTSPNPYGAFTVFLRVVNKDYRRFKFFLEGFSSLLIPQNQPSRRTYGGFFNGSFSSSRVV